MLQSRFVAVAALILFCAGVKDAQILLRYSSVEHYPSVDHIDQHYKDFDNKFWFGNKVIERGSLEATRIGDDQFDPEQVEEFDDKLWFFAPGLTGGRLSLDLKGRKPILRIAYVSKGSLSLNELDPLESLGSVHTFVFDQKLWVLIGTELYSLAKGDLKFEKQRSLPAEPDIGWARGKFQVKEFSDKLWIASVHSLCIIDKGQHPTITIKTLPGVITGLETAGNSTLFVSSTAGLYYVVPQDTSLHQLQELSGEVSIYGFGPKLWIRNVEHTKNNAVDATPVSKETTEHQFVLEFGRKSPLLSIGKTTPIPITLVNGEAWELIPIENIKQTQFKEVIATEELLGRLFVILKENYTSVLYQLAQESSGCDIGSDFRRDYVWHQKESANALNKIGDELYISSPSGITEYTLVRTGSGKCFSVIDRLAGSIVETNVVGNEKHLWFFVTEGMGRHDILYHLDRQASVDVNIQSTPSYLKTIINYLLLGKYLVEGESIMEIKLLNEQGRGIYDQGAIYELLTSYNQGASCDPRLSQPKDVKPALSIGRQQICFVVQDGWPNRFELKQEYTGIPNVLSSLAVVPILFAIIVSLTLILAPYNVFCHDLVMNPMIRKFGSFGILPLALSIFPSVRRHVMKRYSTELLTDEQFKNYFLYPANEFRPEKFGKALSSIRRVLLLGQSGIGKTSYFKHLTHYYARSDNHLPKNAIPVYITLANYQNGITLERLIFDQLQTYGRMSDDELNEWLLKQGGFLLFFDGVNEIPDASLRINLAQFLERHWRANFICLSSQHDYSELKNLKEVRIKPLDKEQITEYLRKKLGSSKAEEFLREFTDKTYRLYQVPRDLDFAIEIKLRKGSLPLPQRRDALYEEVLSPIIEKWETSGRSDYTDLLYRRAFELLVSRETYFLESENSLPEDFLNALSDDRYRLLVKLGGRYVFEHDLLRAYLAAKYFSSRWKRLLHTPGVLVDYNWLEMLRFALLAINEPEEIQRLMEELLNNSEATSFIGELFNWLKTQDIKLSRDWEDQFKIKFATKNLDQISS